MVDSLKVKAVIHLNNSNWTFIVLNPYSKGTLRQNKTKTVNQFHYPETEKSPSTMENAWGK